MLNCERGNGAHLALRRDLAGAPAEELLPKDTRAGSRLARAAGFWPPLLRTVKTVPFRCEDVLTES